MEKHDWTELEMEDEWHTNLKTSQLVPVNDKICHIAE